MAALLKTMRESLEEIVQCAVCTRQLVEPKELECRHSFCKECLRKWCERPRSSKEYVNCPYCGKQSKLDMHGVDGLPAAFNKNSLLDILATHEKPPIIGKCSVCTIDEVGRAAMSYCDECNEYMCEVCLEDHNKTQDPKQAHTTYCNLYDLKIFCSLHNFKKLNFFCCECEVLVCNRCVRKAHRGHNTMTLAAVSEERRKKLHQVLEQLKEQVRNVNESDGVQQQKANLEAMFMQLREEVETCTRQAKQALDTCKESTLKDLDRQRRHVNYKLDRRDNNLKNLATVTAYYEKQLECKTPRQLFDSFQKLLDLANSYLNLAIQKDIPRWTFVPVPLPIKVGNLVLQNADASKAHSSSQLSPETD